MAESEKDGDAVGRADMVCDATDAQALTLGEADRERDAAALADVLGECVGLGDARADALSERKR